MDYTVIKASDFIKHPKAYVFPKHLSDVSWISTNGKNKKCYVNAFCGFDIETYTTPEHYGYMYIWQFSLYTGAGDNYVIIGRVWSEFVQFIKSLIAVLNLTKERRIIVGVANLSFEHQFIKKYFHWTKTFARERRQPLLAILDDCIEFRDVLAITGGSLKTLAKEYTKTQKLDGDDFNYLERRTYKTKLTPDQLQYCINDVVIVSEFMIYLFDTYIKPERYVPLTKTGLLRRQVKKAMRPAGKRRDIMREVYRCYPADFNLYSDLMQYCFRGGYTHANIRYVDRFLTGDKSFLSRDITSSYPYTMIAYDGFPVSPLRRENPADFEKLYNGEKHCLMFRAIFTNLRAKTDHAIESVSKCVTVSKNAIIDNGRIRRASLVCVWLTELDFNMYQLFYDFDSVKIEILYSSLRGRLPRYILDPLADAYKKKAQMKHDGKSGTTEYALYKSLVNSAYGMMVTKMNVSEVKMSELSYKWYLDNSEFDYNKERSKAFSLPQWGIYVCAYSRIRILLAIYNCGKDAIYTDTDSIKYMGDHEKYFDAINKKTADTMKKVCKMYGYDYKYFYDLGSFEKEFDGKKVSGKFLGAKRYLITDQDETEVTIAGLPKKSLPEFVDRLNLQRDMFEYGSRKTIYDVFNDGMLLNAEVSCKNAHTYNDDIHTSIVDGDVLTEMSSVGIYPIDFTMKLSAFYMALIQMEKEREVQYENRIH